MTVWSSYFWSNEVADCSSRHLLDVPQDLNPDIISLDMGYNNLTILRNTSFLKYLQLSYLELEGNSIRDIESGTFHSLINLQTLTLTGNANLELHSDIFQWSCALKILYVSGCGLSGFKFDPGLKDSNPQHETAGMDLDNLHSKSVDSCTHYALRLIDLKENNIMALTNETLFIELQLYHLFLEGNPLHRVDPDAVAAIDVVFLYFGRYPLSLDVIKNITLGVAKSDRIILLSIVYASITYIPPDLFDELYNKTLSSLNLQGNNLILTPALFKNIFSLYSLNLRNNQIKSIASDAIIGLTSLEILELQENELLYLPSNFLISLTSLIELKLDFNKLSYLDEDVFVSSTTLTTLTLSNNHLVGFNRSTFDPLRSTVKSIDISGNSLVCDCHIEWLVEFFNGSSPTFLNKEDTFCSPSSASLEPLRGKPFATFEYDKYCGFDIRLILGITAGVFAIFALSISFIISYHYRWFLGYKLFLLKLAIIGYNEIQDGRDQGEFEYDINVMFVDGDEEWATNNLRPELDRRFPTFDRIAFGDDELLLGRHYFDAVYYNIEKSFKTILLLSRAAVQDHIFMTKFRIAMNHVTDTETDNLILVLLEDIPNQELPYLVRLHLSGQGVYLHWEEHEDGQEYFWNKLTKHLNINLRVNHMIPPE